MQVLVSGANGLVGAALLRRMVSEATVQPVAGVRELASSNLLCEQRAIGDLAIGRVAAEVLRGVEVVVHAAARVHVMQEHEQDQLAAYRSVNVDGTRALLTAAALAGVRRFVFVSSVKVNGEISLPGKPFSEADAASPQDAYARSKWEAEQVAQAFCERHGMEWVVVRPPLVYGPGVRANFRRMMQALGRGLPLPVGALHNRRSLVALENLVDFLFCCVTHPMAANQQFLVSDGQDLSVAELSQKLAVALGSRSWLVPLPSVWLSAMLNMIGRGAAAQRLCGELRVDSGKARTLLGWKAPQGVDEALDGTVRHFLREAQP
ncbi:NAD-dependent epimerase/dehydratase family protein [Stutzerimonas kunmingensis]|uniref:NAD-dependent epimerase/dehydratase family protein n=1 Tax=Stutzerimonas kunmingensis TaxID=1211807 RepID=UPI0037D18573